MLAVEAQGHDITTVEGIGKPDKLNAVPKRLSWNTTRNNAGFARRVSSWPRRLFRSTTSDASVEQVRAGLGGNLCRCGTYAGMLPPSPDAAKGKA